MDRLTLIINPTLATEAEERGKVGAASVLLAGPFVYSPNSPIQQSFIEHPLVPG